MAATEHDEPESILDHPIVSQRYFFPRPAAPARCWPVELAGATLACCYEHPHPDSLTVVHFHGNGEVVADYEPWFCREWLGRGLNVLLVEYRGYGASTGTPQLVAMLDDVDAVFEALGLPAEQVVVFGRSVGSIYALELAARHPDAAGLVLESGIADPLERILLRVRPEELGATLDDLERAARRHLDHARKLTTYQGPRLVLHTVHDSLIDASHAERLAGWGAPAHSRLVLLPEGDHNSVMMLNWSTYWAEIDRFLAYLGPNRRTGA